jgi:polysaccharide export outer membrane protein
MDRIDGNSYANAEYIIGPEDVLEINVWKNPDLSRTVTVRPDGVITLPLIGEGKVAGLTPRELREKIRKRLGEYYKDIPEVTVTVNQVNSYNIYVLGEVRNPGKYQIKSFTTVLQAIALAGGFSESADKDNLVILRKGQDGNDQRIKISYKDFLRERSTKPDIVLQPGDTLIIGAALFLGIFPGSQVRSSSPSNPASRLTASVTVSQRYDNNVFLAPQGEISDYIIRVTPELRISPSKRTFGHLLYRAQLEQYKLNSDLNTLKHFGELELTPYQSTSTSLTLTDHFSYTPDSAEASPLGLVVPRGDVYTNDSTLRLQISRLNLNYRHGLQDYKVAGLTDTMSHKFEESVTLPLFWREMLTQSYLLRYYLQNHDTALYSHTVGIGLRHYFTSTFWVGAEGGVAYWHTLNDAGFHSSPTMRYEVENRFDFKRPAGQLRLHISYLDDIRAELVGGIDFSVQKTQFGLDYSKGLTVEGGVLDGLVDRQLAGIHLQQGIGKKTELGLAAGYGIYQSVSGSQDRFESYRGEVNLAYLIRPWLKTGVYYQYRQQVSNQGLSANEFRNNLTMVSVTTTIP